MSEKPPRARTSASDETRARILDAARDLAVEEGFGGFTVEKVAERADVSRMTVYYQFGTKASLLESLFDHIAARGRIDRLAEAFQEPDPLDGLTLFIDVFCGFWASDRVGLRRLRGWSALESGETESPQGRDARRREGLEVMIRRIHAAHGVPAENIPGVIDILQALTSFETFDSLAGRGRPTAEISTLLNRSARAILGLER